MSNGKPYSIFKRGRIFYAQFKLPNNQWGTAKSTGKTSKGQADAWAVSYLTTGKIVTKVSTLREYATDFFSWEGTWATDRRVRGLRLSPHHCQDCNRLLEKHVFPALGEKKLTAIDRATIRDFRNELFKQNYSGGTINKTLSVIKMILDAALDDSLIQYVPKIDRAADNQKQRGTFTVDEVKKLFSIEWISDTFHCHPPREQFKGYAGNLLACSTGLRMSEIQALVLSDIHLKDGYINVRRAWDRVYGMKQTTKSGRARNIIIPGIVATALSKLIEMNPYHDNPDSFLFFGDLNPNKPIESKTLTRTLYTAMRKIGIDEEVRRNRNLTFHSHRHFFNSLLVNAKVPLQKIQSQTGHLTPEMTQLYYHSSIDDMSDIRAVQDSLFHSLPSVKAVN